MLFFAWPIAATTIFTSSPPASPPTPPLPPLTPGFALAVNVESLRQQIADADPGQDVRLLLLAGPLEPRCAALPRRCTPPMRQHLPIYLGGVPNPKWRSSRIHSLRAHHIALHPNCEMPSVHELTRALPTLARQTSSMHSREPRCVWRLSAT